MKFLVKFERKLGVGTALAVCTLWLAPSVVQGATLPDSLQKALYPLPTGVAPSIQQGAAVALNELYTVVGVPEDSIGGQSAGTVRVYNTGSGGLVHILKHPSGPGIGFGRSVAISGSRVAVGCRGDAAGPVDYGRVFVFDLAGTTPTVPVLSLTKAAPAEYDSFGQALAFSGTRLAVGTPGDSFSQSRAGRVFIYDIGGANPSIPISTLNNPSPSHADEFGFALALSGDYLAVGAPNADTFFISAGRVYVYHLAGGNPGVPVLSLENPSQSSAQNFGQAVALSGSRLAVSIPTENNGRVRVFDLLAPNPAQPKFSFSNPVADSGAFFGWSLAMAGNHVVVGARFDDSEEDDCGRAYLYNLESPTPSNPVATITHPQPRSNEQFGFAVAAFEDRFVVSAPRADLFGYNMGMVWGFDALASNPAQSTVFYYSTSPGWYDNFGNSLALSGGRLAVGSPGFFDGNVVAGRVDVFELDSATPDTPSLSLLNPTPATGDVFGRSVALSGDQLVVGASMDGYGGSGPGRALVYNLAGPAPSTPAFSLTNPSPGAHDSFGAAAAFRGSIVAVGAPGSAFVGKVCLYELANPNPAVPTRTLASPDNLSSAQFGRALALSDTQLAVGAPGDLSGSNEGGSVYVFGLTDPPGSAPTHVLRNPRPILGAGFGTTLALSSSWLAVGCPGDLPSGAVYLYDLSTQDPAASAVKCVNPSPGSTGFGSAISLQHPIMVVGAPSPGTAYAYDLSGPNPNRALVALVKTNGVLYGGNFGRALAFDGARLIVGCPGDSTISFAKGAAFVFGKGTTDTDNDGLPDSWENRFFKSLVRNGSGDFDGDGMDDFSEYVAGTVPTIALHVTRVTRVYIENATPVIEWASMVGKRYQVQVTSGPLDFDWRNLAEVTATGTLSSAFDLDGRYPYFPNGRFYRVVVLH